MRKFIDLYLGLDETKSTNKKQELLMRYFATSPADDSIWVIFFLSGRRFKRFIGSRNLRKWAREKLDYPRWLVDEGMIAVGDSGEAISLLLDTKIGRSKVDFPEISLSNVIADIIKLGNLNDQEQKLKIFQWWEQLDQSGIFLLNKLLTGGFRVGVSKQTVVNAIAKQFKIPKTTVLHRMMGKWDPKPEFFEKLISVEDLDSHISRPYPFYLASQIEAGPEELGEIVEWLIEWKWDGIRAQLVKRDDQTFLWSRGEELINTSFPEIIENSNNIPNGTVLDGEILCFHDGKPMAFSVLQRRIGRENVTNQIKQDAPVIFMIYDILEHRGKDIRDQQIIKRKKYLVELVQELPKLRFIHSKPLELSNWQSAHNIHLQSREQLTEGFILKRSDSIYKSGRKRGDWWKWKIDPLSIDVILIYAQSGSGRRANLFTAYTFAVWDKHRELIPVVKAYSGLTDKEIRKLDKWIRGNTQQRFGPVRSVEPYHVFEIGFDGIMSNNRVKSGVGLRFPRILRWRHDKNIDDANTLEDVKKLLKYEGITEIQRNTSLDDFFD